MQADAYARCAWCGAPARVGAGRLAVCSACGTATTYPAPDEAELECAYARYRPESGRFSGGGDAVLRFSRAILARRLDRIAPPGPILDVGSGDGTLVAALRVRGREAVGLEREANAPGAIAREIDEFDERPGEWAAVVFWHSLEHLRDPASAIDRAVSLLARRGVLAIAVPNSASWQAQIFGARWFHLDIPRHFVHLTADALCRGVRERGVQVERVSYWRGGQLVFGWLHGMVGALPGHADLYSAIRRPEAREEAISGARRAGALTAAAALSPLAAILVAGEVAAHAGGTIYVEARRP